jgi:hypothetical protein
VVRPARLAALQEQEQEQESEDGSPAEVRA